MRNGNAAYTYENGLKPDIRGDGGAEAHACGSEAHRTVVDIHDHGGEQWGDTVTVTAPEPMPASMPKTRGRRRAREYQRIAVRCGCWLEHEDATVYGNTVDLARGGLFLRTALPMRPGSHVRVTLHLPGQEPVVAEGRVVRRVSPRTGHRPGLGVRFEKLLHGDESLAAFLFGSLESDESQLAFAG